MIQRSLNHKCRAAALIGAAVVFSAASQLHAQALANLFGGTQSNNAATETSLLQINGSVSSGNMMLGSGYVGSVTINNGLSVVSTLTETVNTPTTPNSLVVATSGLGATVGGSFMATNSFAINTTTFALQPNTQYQFGVTRGTSSQVSLLGNVVFQLGLNGTPFVDTSTGTGILGGLAVNVLGLLGNTGSANFIFTTPATIPNGSALNFTVSGNLGANVLPGSFALTGAAITNVPEPGTVASAFVGLLGLAVWRARRGQLI